MPKCDDCYPFANSIELVQIGPLEVYFFDIPRLKFTHLANKEFQALGMNGQQESLYDIEDGASEPTDNDDDEGEDDPVKLFVGQVSKLSSLKWI